MNSTPVTLADIFSVDQIPRERFAWIASDKMTLLRKAVAKNTRTVTWPQAANTFRSKIVDLLQVGIREIIENAWKKNSAELAKNLKECKIKSTHNPTLEILIGGQRRAEIEFDIEAVFTLKNIRIEKSPDGRTVKAIAIAGPCEVEGEIRCDGTSLLKLPKRPLRIPGMITFGEAIPLSN